MTESLIYICIINIALCTLAVSIHFRTLTILSYCIQRVSWDHRARILLGLFGSITGHVIEIWVFAFGYYYLLKNGGHGALRGNFNGSLLDCSYFSFVTYTTTGFGDIHPVGDVRYLAGLEALIGVVMISWTASFLFIEMQRYWGNSHGKKN